MRTFVIEAAKVAKHRQLYGDIDDSSLRTFRDFVFSLEHLNNQRRHGVSIYDNLIERVEKGKVNLKMKRHDYRKAR